MYLRSIMGKEEQGVDRQRYHVVPRTLILMFDGDAVLLLKGAPNKKIWAGKFNGLGGHVERGEDALSAAYRELAEESGITDVGLSLCGTILCDVEDDFGVAVFVYKGNVKQRTVQNSQEGELRWVQVRELRPLDLVDDMRVIIPRVLDWKVGDGPFSALNFYNEKGNLVTQVFGE